MVATCSGCNGAPCGCQQFIPRHGKPLKCSGCKHPKSFHPPTATGQGESSTAPAPRNIDQILEQYGGLDWIRPKTSVGDARKETNAGLKSHGELEHLPQGAKATQFRVSISNSQLYRVTYKTSIAKIQISKGQRVKGVSAG
jgi:hypothetical protein